MPDLIHCSDCGAKVPLGRFCSECGATLPGGITRTSRPPLPGRINLGNFPAILEAVELSTRPYQHYGSELGTWGLIQNQELLLVRGAGGRAEELAARFVQRIESRDMSDVKMLRAKMQMADGLHIVVHKPLPQGAEANLVVRFHGQGSDALLGWNHCEVPEIMKIRGAVIGAIVFGVIAFFIFGMLVYFGILLSGSSLDGKTSKSLLVIVTYVGGIIGAFFGAKDGYNSRTKIGIQNQHSASQSLDLQFSVRAALKEAIDVAELSKQLQMLDKDIGRVI